MSTRELLDQLKNTPSRAGVFSLCVQLGRCWIGKSADGRAALLIPCPAMQSSVGRAFGAIIVRFAPAVLFDVQGETWSVTSAIIECLDDALLPTFVSLAADVAATLARAPEPMTSTDVLRALANWELLLRSRNTLSDQEQLGLWAELCFILESPSVDGSIRAWSPGARDLVDFVHAGVGLELKASGVRFKHTLSLHQRRAGEASLELLFGSLWILPDGAGSSLPEMVDRVAEASSELVAFEQKLLLRGFVRSQSSAYVRRFARVAPLALFRAERVPAVRTFDPGVSSIHYTVDLDAADALDDAESYGALKILCGVSV